MTKRSAQIVGQYNPYPLYKKSDAEWIAMIPAHWEVKRLKYTAKINPQSDLGGVSSDTEVSFVPMEAVGEYGGLDLSRTKQLGSIGTGYTSFRDGDVIVAKITPCFENGKGACVARLVNGIGFGTTELHVLRSSRSLDKQFLFYVTLSSDFRRLGEGEMYGAGGQKRVPESFVANLRHPIPPLSEQRAIAAFLDRETERIDVLVAKEERLIDLLDEERAALVTQAVTRGLDPHVPMKDSGVEWLRETPSHWQVKPLKAIGSLQTGFTLGKKYEGQRLTTRPYLRVANVQDGFLALDDVAEVELPEQDAARYELRPGDVLMTEGGDFDKLGRGYVWEGQISGCLHQNHIFAIRPRREVLDPSFVAFVTSSGYGRAYFTATSKQSTNLASTNSTKLKSLPLGIPSVAEQHEIVRWIYRETARIDALISKVQEAISHLHELRTALISAAVTGKIDVRESA